MEKRDQIRKKIEKLALAPANDGVRLALLGRDGVELIGGMDLSPVTEFKQGANGTVEVKFVDRIGALQWLCETQGRDLQKSAENFFAGLEKSADGQ